jgi:hypothetical protein
MTLEEKMDNLVSACIILVLASTCWSSAFAAEVPEAPQPQPVTSTPFRAGKTFSKPSRGPRKLLVLAAAVGFDIAADHYDIAQTERGLRAGVAVEGNTWLASSHPTAGQLYRRDLLVIGLTATPSTLAYIFRSKAFFYGGLGTPIIIGIKHIQGGRQWGKLLAGQKPTGSELGP